MGQTNTSVWDVFEIPAGIQMQRVSSWKWHVGLRSEEEVRSGTEVSAGALRERLTEAQEECLGQRRWGNQLIRENIPQWTNLSQ